MRVHELKNSKYLTKEDCGDGIVVTFKGFHQDNVSLPGKAADIKWIAELEEDDYKDLVLNPTNGDSIELFLGSDNSDDWIGKKVVLYNDTTVKFGTEVTGGIRVRKHDAVETSDETEKEDIPW